MSSPSFDMIVIGALDETIKSLFSLTGEAQVIEIEVPGRMHIAVVSINGRWGDPGALLPIGATTTSSV